MLGTIHTGCFKVNRRPSCAVYTAAALGGVTGRVVIVIIVVHGVIGAIEGTVEVVIIVERVVALWVARRVQSILTCEKCKLKRLK